MGNHYSGSLGYADDLTLLAPTLSGLQVLYLYLYDRLDQRRFDVMTRVPV